MAEIKTIKSKADATYVNKANKSKNALNYLQQACPITQNNWVTPGANKGRAIKYTQIAMPPSFNPNTPQSGDIYKNKTSLQPANGWVVLADVQSVEDFIYKSAHPVGAVLIHRDAHQAGMDTIVDGTEVIDHIKSVLWAVSYCGGVCALHIGDAQPLLPALQPPFNSFGMNAVVVNERGRRRMGGYHDDFNFFVARYATSS